MSIKIEYIHPAFPPKNIRVGQVYECNIKDDKVDIFNNKNISLHENLNFVKNFFSPIDGLKWSDILSTKPGKDMKK